MGRLGPFCLALCRLNSFRPDFFDPIKVQYSPVMYFDAHLI